MLAGLAVFLDHPWIGVGPGQYVPSYSQEYQQLDEVSFRSLPRPREAHSLFVAIAAETGAAGLAAFALAVGVPFVALGRARRYWRRWSPRQADLAAALQLSVVGYLATGVFLHLSYERYLWFLLGLAGAALLVLRHDRGGERGSA
jgi:O-antigen ligase